MDSVVMVARECEGGEKVGLLGWERWSVGPNNVFAHSCSSEVNFRWTIECVVDTM